MVIGPGGKNVRKLQEEYEVQVDINDDGLPDAWQTANFGAADAPNGGPNDDWDSDRVRNLDEYISGTCPTDGWDTFRLQLDAVDGAQVLSFLARQTRPEDGPRDRYYALDRLTNPVVPWEGVPAYTSILATNQLVVYTNDPAGGAPVFYRGRVWLQGR